MWDRKARSIEHEHSSVSVTPTVTVSERDASLASVSVPVSFGEWLKQHRRESGITREDLAAQTACSSITLQKIEAGERRPSRQIALRLATLFHVPADEQEAFVAFARTLSPRAPVATSPLVSMSPSPATPGVPHPEAESNEQKQTRTHSPWRAVHLSKSNLPLVLTTLIGREQEQDKLCSRLRQSNVRLLTLTGSPGTGKTRLSIAVAAALLGDFEDGVYLAELAPLSDPAMVIPAIARTLGLRETGTQLIEETLLAHIKDKRMLLVLDNFEHLLDAGPEVVKLIQASPWIKVLVTSREALHVRGEQRYPLPPLSLPVLADRPSLEELARNPAVQLFTERAQSADMDFALTEENALEVAEVCVNLGGLPLAIELAAGRVSLFPPRTLLSRLGQQLKVLTGGSRDLPPRQRTLRGAIAWSYDLLDAGHKELFRRMAVFWGGQTLHSVEAVCNAAGLAAAGQQLRVDVGDGVETLLSSNLLQQRESSAGEPRFWMLETIHEYATETLEESGEAPMLQREHALYFMRLAEEAEPHLTGTNQQAWLQRLEDEYDNLRTALAWAGDRARSGSHGGHLASGAESSPGGNQEEGEIGLRTAGALWRFWLVRSLLTEGREQLGRALSLPEGVLQECSPGSRAKALNGAGYLAGRQGDYSSARSLSEASLILGWEAGDTQSISLSVNNLGAVAYEEGDYTKACAMFEESLALRRTIGDKWGIAMSLNNLGIVAYEQGDFPRAGALHAESLALLREIGDRWGIAMSLNSLGNVACEQGDYTGARALHEECLALGREIGDKKSVAACLAGLGGAAIALGQEGLVEKAATLLGAAQGLLQSMGAVLDRDDRLPYERAVASARYVLGEAAFEKAGQEGRGMSLEEAVNYALAGTDNRGGRP